MRSKWMAFLAALPLIASFIVVVGNAITGWLTTNQEIGWAATAAAVIKVIVEVARYVQAGGVGDARHPHSQVER